MQRIKLAELASRQAELASEDDISTSSTSSSEHDRTLSKSASATTPNVESNEEMEGDDDGALLGMDNPQTAGNREDELRERISAAQERMQYEISFILFLLVILYSHLMRISYKGMKHLDVLAYHVLQSSG